MPTPPSISTLNRRSFFKSAAFGTAAPAIPGFTQGPCKTSVSPS
jgi:hypothetical protein